MWNDKLKVEYEPLRRKPRWMLLKDLVYTLEKRNIRTLNDEDDLWNISDWSELGLDIKVTREDIIIKVASPFLTDLASTHRSIWWFLSPWDIARPAVIHDRMYRLLSKHKTHKKFDRMRKQADLIFWYGMKEVEPQLPYFKRIVAYFFLRIFGRWKL